MSDRPLSSGSPSASARQAICPSCERRFVVSDSRTMPFCSERCRLIDLGRWLDERISMPYDRPEDETEPLEGE
jgi:endogenous inhibitor of DNA gyrase (YacG/DUF329 family)